MQISHFILLPVVNLLDYVLGEPVRWHPLNGFNKLTQKVEKSLNTTLEPFESFAQGIAGWVILVIPAVITAWVLTASLGWLMEALIASLMLGSHKIKEHAAQITHALKSNDMAHAQQLTHVFAATAATKAIKNADSKTLIQINILNILKNSHDTVFAPLFWFLIGGAPGIVLFRLSNRLDSKWGYKNEQFLCFGRFTAYANSLLGYIPARLTAATWLIMGNYKTAEKCWRTQGHRGDSLNKCVVMATGAGALDIKLSNNAISQDNNQSIPVLGTDKEVSVEDITRSWKLVFHGILLWSGVSVLVWLLFH